MNYLKTSILLVYIFLFSACGSVLTRYDNADSENPSEEELTAEKTQVVLGEPVTSELGKIPNEMNASVQKWVNYFTGRGRPHMTRYLERSSRYLDLMKKTLKDEGVPDDLVYISLIESGFRSKAISHASAVGYWQFIRGTGKRYGLIINSTVDERLDPVHSTQAAARYFKALYNLFGNWYLAMASYNAGENRIKRAVMNNYTRDFWQLASRRKLPRETINYVPKFLAAKLIAENPHKFGFTNINFQPALAYERIPIEHPIDLLTMSKELSVSYSDLQKLNPAFRSRYIPVYRKGESFIRIPVGMRDLALVAVPKAKAKTSSLLLTDGDTYRVRRGDSLYVIAKRFGTTIHKLKDMNNISGSHINIGDRLKIPGRYVSGRPSPIRYAVNTKYHRVRRGENLTSIASKYGLSLSEIRDLNRHKISRRSVIRVGQKLLVKRGPSAEGLKIHIVRRGETLSHIARRYRVSIGKLTQLNSIEKSSRIYVGKRLVIPD
ncbi:MAG: LysM peptidoglycan-binding domain-containing protein [Bdellovibrionales bacterium]|nr:LysM peptidoglycan-binding domain-containing protein [Bdellovibrionales bacterium]